MKDKKPAKPKKEKSTRGLDILLAAISAAFITLIIVFAYSMGRSSKAAEMSAETKESEYMNYWINGTHYINFYNSRGGMTVINYTLDSMKRELLNPPPVTLQLMPIDTLKWKD